MSFLKISHTACDLTIETLADSEADLRAELGKARATATAYRDLARSAMSYAHDLLCTVDKLRASNRRLLSALRESAPTQGRAA